MKYPGEDLFEEKTLWGIYKKSILRLSHSRFNTVTTLLLFIILAIHTVVLNPKFTTLVSIVRALVETALGFGSSILGFLIAGFTIFATLTKPSLFVMMYKATHKDSQLNYLKHNFFAFIEVFVIYLILLGSCILVKILGAPDGALIQILNVIAEHTRIQLDETKLLIVKFAYVIFGVLFYYSLVSLKSFIFNIYHIVITSIVWEMKTESAEDQSV